MLVEVAFFPMSSSPSIRLSISVVSCIVGWGAPSLVTARFPCGGGGVVGLGGLREFAKEVSEGLSRDSLNVNKFPEVEVVSCFGVS